MEEKKNVMPYSYRRKSFPLLLVFVFAAYRLLKRHWLQLANISFQPA